MPHAIQSVLDQTYTDFEIIIVEDEMEKLISVSPSHAQILAFTQKQGSMTMYQDAVLKVLEGITALEEVERIVGQ